MFRRERAHKGGDNTPLIEIIRENKVLGQPVAIPSDYADFISEEQWVQSF